jgi:hypothetical protein
MDTFCAVKHINRLDGHQPTSRAGQLAHSVVQSIVSVLQTKVTAHGIQALFVKNCHYMILAWE